MINTVTYAAPAALACLLSLTAAMGRSTPANGRTAPAEKRSDAPAATEGEAAPAAGKFNKSTAALESEVFGDGQDPTVRRGPPGASAVPATAFPVVAPRLVSFALGTSLMGRRFAVDAPLQTESRFPLSFSSRALKFSLARDSKRDCGVPVIVRERQPFGNETNATRTVDLNEARKTRNQAEIMSTNYSSTPIYRLALLGILLAAIS